jgi:PEP-CTERM motif
MKRSISIVTITAISALLAVVSQTSAQTTVFNDTFTSGNDTVQNATPQDPTANSTAFEYFQQGANPATPVLSSGDLQLRGRTTSSSISEVQALFTTTPVTLATIGDYIDLTIVFLDTTNIFPSGSASTLNIGLYNSGGSKPTQGVRLDASGSGAGGAVGWQGYVGRIGGTGGATSQLITRTPQGPGLTNPNQSQDVLFSGASGSSTYNNPSGTGFGASTQLAAGLTGGSTYTLDFRILLSAANTLTISNALYSGSSVDSANLLFSDIGTASGTTFLTNAFDAFALGWRYNSASGPSAVDVSSITVSDLIAPIPEPTTFALAGMGIIGLMAARRFRRS